MRRTRLDVPYFREFGVWRLCSRRKIRVMNCTHVRVIRSGTGIPKKSHIDRILDAIHPLEDPKPRQPTVSSSGQATDFFRFSRRKFPSALLEVLGDAYWLIPRSSDGANGANNSSKEDIYLTTSQISKIDTAHWNVTRFETMTRYQWRKLTQQALNKPLS